MATVVLENVTDREQTAFDGIPDGRGQELLNACVSAWLESQATHQLATALQPVVKALKDDPRLLDQVKAAAGIEAVVLEP